jgi:hypothetical protein
MHLSFRHCSEKRIDRDSAVNQEHSKVLNGQAADADIATGRRAHKARQLTKAAHKGIRWTLWRWHWNVAKKRRIVALRAIHMGQHVAKMIETDVLFRARAHTLDLLFGKAHHVGDEACSNL